MIHNLQKTLTHKGKTYYVSINQTFGYPDGYINIHFPGYEYSAPAKSKEDLNLLKEHCIKAINMYEANVALIAEWDGILN